MMTYKIWSYLSYKMKIVYVYSIKPIFLKVERWMSSHWLIYSYTEKFVEMLVAYVDVIFKRYLIVLPTPAWLIN